MVQRAIKDDLLRYQKTLLVWKEFMTQVPGEDECKSSNEVDWLWNEQKIKIEKVKKALIEVLAENWNGISLAQLPVSLKNKLSYSINFNELGFAKIKDFILSMKDDVALELKGHSHPLAYLIDKGKNPHQDIHS